jgi:hypothetical protein
MGLLQLIIKSRLTNEKRKELAREGKFYTADGTRYRRSYRKKLAEKNYYVDSNGYKRFMDSDVLVHRWVAEKYILGRKLLPDEEVHHKNRNKLDNRVKNLQVTTHGRHVATHVVSKLLTGRK